MIINQETVQYTDLALSAYLVMRFKLLELRRINENRYEFVFEKTPELEKCREDYFSNSAQVSPADYFDSLKRLKSQIYMGR